MKATVNLTRKEVEEIFIRALEDNFRAPLEVIEISVLNHCEDERFLQIEFQKKEVIPPPPALAAYQSATEATHQETSPHPTSPSSEDDPIPF